MAQTNVAWREAIRNWRVGLLELVITSDGGASESTVLSIARLCPQLHKLALSDTFDNSRPGKTALLTDKSAAELATHCTEMRELEGVGICDALTDHGVTTLIRGCSNLVHLCLDSGFSVQGWKVSVRNAFVELAAHCPRLRGLNLTNIPDAVDAPSNAQILGLIRGCPELARLACEVDAGASPTTLVELADSCSFETLCLNSFSEFTRGDDGCLPLTDAFIFALSRNSPGLRHLQLGPLAGAQKISDAAWKSLARRCRVLQKLECDSQFGDDVISEFTMRCGLKPGLYGDDIGYREVDGKRKRLTRWTLHRNVLLSDDWPRWDDDVAPPGTLDGDETLRDVLDEDEEEANEGDVDDERNEL